MPIRKEFIWVDVDMPDFGAVYKAAKRISYAVPFEQTCREVVMNAKKRVRAKQSAHGGRYKDLAPKTVKDKIREGATLPSSPLRRTHQMLRDLFYSGKGNHWRVGFKTSASFAKAVVHIVKGASRNKVIRAFMRRDFDMTATEKKRHMARIKRHERKEIEHLENLAYINRVYSQAGRVGPGTAGRVITRAR